VETSKNGETDQN